MDAIAVARYGMMNAAQRLDSAASRIADPDGGFDPSTAVDLTLAKTQFKANIATLRIADEMQRALLDLQTEHN